MDRAFRPALCALACLWAVSAASMAQGDPLSPPARPRNDLISLRSVQLNAGSQPSGGPRASGEARNALDSHVKGRFLVHFSGEPRQIREGLETLGMRVETYLPWNTFLVTTTGGAIHRLQASKPVSGVDFVVPYRPAFRLAPEVVSLHPGPGTIGVLIHLFPDADLARVRRRLDTLGVRPRFGGGPHFLRAGFRTRAAHLVSIRQDLARMDEVYWVALRGEVRLFNDQAVPIVQSGSVEGGLAISRHGLLGEGQIIAILDTGLDYESCFFRDETLPPAVNLEAGIDVESGARKVVAYDFLYPFDDPADPGDYDSHGHGTHVAGNAAGDDLANPLEHDSGDGMALGARLVIQDAGYSADDCADLPALGCPVVDLTPFLSQAYDQGARVHSNSWGDNENAEVQNTYSTGSEDVDAFVWSHPDMVVVFAAGNAGPFAGSVSSPSTAKNCLSVGGTWNGDGVNLVYLVSGRGPTGDGRIKPDVMAPANNTSARGDGNIETDNCTLDSGSGTSFAAPLVAGAAALVRQYFMDGYHVRGARSPEDGFAPSAALVKAVLINSSMNMTATTPVPSDDQGWGRVALDRALAFSGDDFVLRVVDGTVAFETSASPPFQMDLEVDDSSVPLKITLVWTDPPSTPAAAINLVNDLDLSLTCGHRTFLGNVFRAGKSVTGGQSDTLNNVEQVFLPLPREGACRIEVSAARIVEGPQDFALVVRGAFH